jgi:hypothetical protein
VAQPVQSIADIMSDYNKAHTVVSAPVPAPAPEVHHVSPPSPIKSIFEIIQDAYKAEEAKPAPTPLV